MEKHLPISTDDARNSVRVTGGAVREAAATGVVQAFAGVRQMPRNPARSDALQEMDSEKSATFRLCRSPAEAPGTLGVPLQLTFCRQRMRALLDAHDIAFRDRIYAMFEQHADLFTPRYGLTVPEERELVMARWAVIREAQLLKGTLNYSPEARGRYDAVMESCGYVDHSLEVKMGVHYGLFGSSVALLGDEQQCRRWLQDIEDARMLGCFALTELGHGSNVRGIETLATYDPGRGEFIIHTPTETAQKYWIGGAAETARWAVVFAKLLTPDGVHRGIHPFLVRLRTDAGEVCHGITIADVGVKQGLNGVDNGRIWFDNVRIPREQMLARYSQVLPDGSYRSSFKTGDEQFAAQLAALTGGRVSISVGAVNRMKTGLCIAIRYALSRRAFAPSGDDEEADATANETHDGKTAPEEMLLMDYQSHQMRLLPMLATTYVLALATNRLKYRWHHRLEDPNPKEIHLWSSGLKAFATWTMSDVLQECRESCGGMGYLAENRIGVLKCDFDVYLTYEGTNIVLVQQVARAQLAAYAAGKLPPPPAVPAITSDRELAEPAFITASLARLHDALVRRLAERLAYATKQNSMKPFFAWNKMCLDLAVDVGKVYTCLLAYRIACDEVRQIDDPVLKQILGYCCALYGLHMLDKYGALLTRMNVYADAPNTLERIHQQVEYLSSLLRPNALALVDAFSIPPMLLAPIAFDWITRNARAHIHKYGERQRVSSHSDASALQAPPRVPDRNSTQQHVPGFPVCNQATLNRDTEIASQTKAGWRFPRL